VFQGDEALRPPAFLTIKIQAGVAVFISGDYDSQTVRQNKSDLITTSRLHASLLLQRSAQFTKKMDMMDGCQGHGRQHEQRGGPRAFPRVFFCCRIQDSDQFLLILIPSHAYSILSTYFILYSLIRTPCAFYLDLAVRRLGLHHMAYRNENLKTLASHTAMPPLRSTPKTLRRLCGTSLATSNHT